MKDESISITNKPDIQLTEKEKFYEQLGNIDKEEQENLGTETVEKPDQENNVNNFDDNDTDLDHDVDNTHSEDASKHLIPRSRLNKELEKRKALEAEIEKEKQERIKAQTELELYTRALEKSFNPQKQDMLEEMNEFAPLDEEAHKYYMQNFQKMNQMQEQLIMQKTLELQEAQFTAKHSDFGNAYQHLLDVQTKINQNLGYSSQEAQNLAISNLRNMANELLSRNKNVAETFYNISKEYGYKNDIVKGPNLDAINENMKKSKTAEVNSLPVNINDGGSHYTKLSEFEKNYKSGDKETFYKMINQIKNNR